MFSIWPCQSNESYLPSPVSEGIIDRTHRSQAAGRVRVLFRLLAHCASLITVLALLCPIATTSQSFSIAQFQNEDALFSALIQSKREEVRNLLEQNQRLITKSLWQKLIQRARVVYYSPNPTQSLAIYEIALEVAEYIKDKSAIASTWYNLGITRSGLRQNAAAIQAYLHAGGLFEEAGLQRDLIYIYSDLSSLYFAAEDYARAKDYAGKSIALADSVKNSQMVAGAWPDKYGVAGALSTLGFISRREGNYTQAIEYLRQSLALYQKLDGSGLKFGHLIAERYSALGGIFNLLGDNQQALLYLDQALKLAQRLQYQHQLASVLNNLGVLYLEQEDYVRATDYFERGLKIYQAQGNQLESARLQLNLALTDQRQENYERALEYFGKSLEQARAISSRELMIAASAGLGSVYQAKGEHAAALEVLERSLNLAKENNDHLRIAEILWRKAEAQSALRNFTEAERLAQEAAKLARQLRYSKLSYLTAATLGRAYIGQGKMDVAAQTLSQAIEQVELMRKGVAGQEQERQLFFEKSVTIYHSLIDLLIGQSKSEEALLYAERAKGRVLLDILSGGGTRLAKALTQKEREEEQRLNRGIVELNRELHNEQSKASPDAARLEQINVQLNSARLKYAAFQDVLSASHPELMTQSSRPTWTVSDLSGLIQDKQTAVLEYVVTRERAYLFVVTKGSQAQGIKVEAIPIQMKESELAKLVNRYHRMMADAHPSFIPAARELYEVLLKPAEPLLHGKTTLCIVPDRLLWDVPFQALQSKTERFVIEEYALYYAPSLSVLLEMRRGKGREAKPPAPSLLAFANPLIATETAGGLPGAKSGNHFEPLPEAETEVKTLAELFGPKQSKLFIGAQADEHSFKTLSPAYRNLHFATHGVLDNLHPLYSYLLLSKTEGDADNDGLLEAREVMNLNLHADLVVLSACDTARGKIGAGEGVIGMTWAFFVAGCRAAVVSQWKVDSVGTAEWMVNFYQQLKQPEGKGDVTKAQALRLAVLQMMGKRQYEHPSLWASFVLIGSND